MLSRHGMLTENFSDLVTEWFGLKKKIEIWQKGVNY